LGSSFGKFINGFHLEEFVLVDIAFEIKVIWLFKFILYFNCSAVFFQMNLYSFNLIFGVKKVL
jgi:hypothetical protein